MTGQRAAPGEIGSARNGRNTRSAPGARSIRSTREFVNPSDLLTPPGPYSQVVRVGDLAFVSGQVGADRNNTLVGPGIAEQTTQALANVGTALASVGLDLGHVVKVTIFVPDAEDLDELVAHMDEHFGAVFSAGLPASTLVMIDRLFDSALRVEIEAIAHA